MTRGKNRKNKLRQDPELRENKTPYKAAEEFSSMPRFHQILGRIYLIILFIAANLGLGIVFYHYPTTGFFRLTAWLLIVIVLGLSVNNFSLPRQRLSLLILVFGIPLELATISFLLGWSWEFYFVEWAFIEFAGIFGGLLMGALFKKADITTQQRLVSIILAIGLAIAVLGGFWPAIEMEYARASEPEWLLLIVPLIHAIYNDSRWFIHGEENKTMNMGSSKLSDQMTPVMGILAIGWLILASLLHQLGQG